MNALQHLIKEGYNDADINAMKDKLEYEGWRYDEFLPDGWMYKIICEGFTKDNKWYNTISYFSREGVLLESMKHVLEHMENHKDYSEGDKENCKAFLETQKSSDRRYEWQEGDETIPKHWKMRVSDTENKWQFFLSPQGKQYRTRYIAILDMFKKGYSGMEIEDMKESMINYENWQRSEYLPFGWMYKIYWEGFTRDKEWTQNIRYLSREGVPYESMKNVLEFMSSKSEYTEADAANCKEFVKMNNAPEKKFEWLPGDDSLPSGWKRRFSEGDAKMEWFLSPQGRMYRSRFVAIQDMIRKNYSEKDVDEMRELMIKHENWRRSAYLPHNWMYKINWEGQCNNGKWSDNLSYLSREGVTFESNRTAIEYMAASSDYDEEDEQRCKEFSKKRNQETQEVRFQWNDGNHTVPKGWKMRKTGEREFILSPEGHQYMSRVVAVTDMVKRGCLESDIEEMRSKLKYEGWKTNQYLPRGWFWKMWEGETRKQRLDRNLFFVTREGVRIESFKAVIEFMETSDDYNQNDIEKINQYKKAEGIDLRRKTYDWEDGGSTLPSGWMKRSGKGQQQDQERILSPEGEQFRSRFNALQTMVKSGAPKSEIDEMKDLLVHEGFTASPLLPPGWLFKRIWEGTDATGRTSSNTQYISDMGELFESVKTAIEYLQVSDHPDVERQINNFKMFQSKQCKSSREKREDWLVDETVPRGWRRRVHETSGKEFILSPDGKQFVNRINALLYLYEKSPKSSEIAEMKIKLSHEGWKEDKLLPEGWLCKILESKQNDRIQRSYKFLSREGTIFESMKSALEFMEICGYYSEDSMENCKKFLKNDSKVSGKPRIQWELNSSITPPGWKTRVQEDGKRLFQIPDGNQFQSMFAAFIHMKKNDYVASVVTAVRSFLKHEGWEYDSLLPSGWQMKTVNQSRSIFLGRNGEYFDSIEKAVDFIANDKSYTIKDLQNLRTKFDPKSLENSSNKRKRDSSATPKSSKKPQPAPAPARSTQKRKSDSELLNLLKKAKKI